ncbi:MAG: AmmeMemoRadiSam system radical SAM enzyme [Candidatus Altiarchaeales archaeon]|nr:AmmeMemoRadiSam system radical SAM enzyme [Candidatus Altiarchaeales archaeon]
MPKRKEKSEIEKALSQKLSRREFLKKAALGAIGVGVGAYALDRIFFGGQELPAASQTMTQSLSKWSKEAYNFIQLGGNRVKCMTCPHGCILDENGVGICRAKVNKNGKLYSIAYGNPCAVHIDPVEKKPLFHFYPGSTAYSLATGGCNLRCLNCQNWDISQASPLETKNIDLMPEQVVDEALSNNCKSIAYTYSDPLAFYEYTLDSCKIARGKGVKNILVTAGYINTAPLKEWCKYVDAAHVDLKSFSEEIYNKLNSATLQPVLNTIKTMKEQGVWVEIINLVVPTWTDKMDMIKQMCEWIHKNCGEDQVLHFSRFYPQHKLTNLPQTPVDTLEQARKTAIDSGLNYVYIGNVPGHNAENTLCPKCGKIVVERQGYTIKQNNLVNGTCKNCGQKIAGIWK